MHYFYGHMQVNYNKTSYEDWLAKSYVKQMSGNQHNRQAATWRKLYLSRAKLKASSSTSALLSGFAMVALVEIQIEEDVSPALLIVFSVCTTLLVSVHLLALMISTCILPNIEAVSNVHNVNAVNESPHEKMNILIQMAWAFSTGLGILLFLTEIVLICWVKFDVKRIGNNKGAAWASTAVVIPVGVIFIIFSFHFYRQLISHKVEQKAKDIEELARLANDIDMNNHNSGGIQIV
ncbi:Protein orai-3,Protein orai-2,Calcium release-activated calcium channel protein 1,Protein orai [Mytilus edulis]|uniref:Protein orai-3,Protein orai-2,Calcium release-activated calcium channel protein 1,Protein orai n=2 Tax=Mytilus TaxID=6548 RepID=A0A8S3UY83_MYTED|nr:Protein orai-3,Protein orai-2,Calcium release-activated calcium channel protein 1,Protein orai [Mytilus edulis]